MRKKIGPRLIAEPGWRDLVCPVCSRHFRRANCTIRTIVVYCSRSCSTSASCRAAPRRAGIGGERPCELCKRTFFAKSNGKTTKRFCSRRCAAIASRAARITNTAPALPCAGCGAPLANKSRRYCSVACYRQNSPRRRPDKRRHAHRAVPRKKGRTYRSNAVNTLLRMMVLEVGACQECGVTEFLQGHHVKPYATHPELRLDRSNILVLCRDCHARKHPERGALISAIMHKPSLTIACATCGETFAAWPYQGARKYCSRNCAGPPPKRFAAPLAEKVCIRCGIDFSVPEKRKDSARFCGNECRLAVLRTTSAITCAECGRERLVCRSLKVRSHFCSTSCAGKSGARARWSCTA